MSSAPLPTPRQLERLTALVRFNFGVADWCVRHLGWWSRLWNSIFMVALTGAACSRRLRLVGLEHVTGLGPQDRVLFVANHRSFFDFFQIMAVTFHYTKLSRRLFFPVRATFFYDHPLGPLVNMLMSGMAMFPPIVRSRAGTRFNTYALDRCVAELRQPGTVMGIHPEGTRNKGPDPYSLLRTTRGVGRVALQAGDGVLVIPVWVLGTQNNLLIEILRNFTQARRYPLDVIFGAPLDLSDLTDRTDDAGAWKIAAQRCMDAILALGDEHRRRYASDQS
ncbi:MAG: 1-acyl-sn-glycerol-3-phosphate acyltransferase [Oligoflexia bacterium]|nr:1-acyl-sn-glycerol-3-phosphate acyltransferase [Oligoflexia bacterium]